MPSRQPSAATPQSRRGLAAGGRAVRAFALQDHDGAVQRFGDLRQIRGGGAAPAGFDLAHQLLGNANQLGEPPLRQAVPLARPGHGFRLLVQPAGTLPPTPAPYLSGHLPTVVVSCTFGPQEFPDPLTAARPPAPARERIHQGQATPRLGVRRQLTKLRLVLVRIVHFDAQITTWQPFEPRLDQGVFRSVGMLHGVGDQLRHDQFSHLGEPL
ncbi:hypothetical protein SBRY_50462 [Actinacidiphila bryophytorum]|uniref:Uncharacterized protein n=1 Tax=Actinacidiphila bryophytorum TaxID=1436133 RepID=A0A9W4H4I6_9ACTN|nr:hypothetical protein SBRY_50462 [Actinacidiphila bryophytorum]